MNFYLLTHDFWFYTTLLLFTGYLTCIIVSYRLVKPYLNMFIALRRGRRKSVLRQKLQG